MSSRALRAAERLAAEFEAGRFDSTLARHLLADDNAFARLLRACFLAERGQLGAARLDIDHALAHADAHPIIEMAAGLLLFVTHDYQRALDRFATARDNPHSPTAARRARQLAINAAVALGWDHDALELLDAAIAADPDHASWHAQTVRAYARGHWRERALDHAERALALAPDHPSLWMEAAVMHAALDRREQALAAVEQALARAPADARLRYLREAGRVAIDAGAFERARACFGDALELDPSGLDVHVWLAELHSWADHDDDARREAERALAKQPEFGPALRLLGALAFRRGDTDRARSLLARAIAATPSDYQAYVWLAELELRAANYEQAHAWLHHAVSQSGGYLVVASLIRYLVVAYDEGTEPGEIVAHNRTDEFEQVMHEVAPQPTARALHSRAHLDMIDAVEATLAALRGNRSIHTTHVINSQLVRLHGQTGCRHESRKALQLLRVAAPEVCVAAFDEVVDRYPHSSLPLCHRGELHLWLGNWTQARADLEAAIAKVTGTRWAYMGLSTLDLLAGDPQACLATNARGVAVMRDSEGPAIWVFRGEAMRRLGRLDEAIAELERAVEFHPARASAVINLALALAVRGESERVHALWRRLAFEQACGLMSDAARELADGTPLATGARFGARLGDAVPCPAVPAARELFTGRDTPPPIELIVTVLERALAMMGGNRSSGLLTYWTTIPSGATKLRFVQQWPHGNLSPHTRDHARIAQAKQLLIKALASVKS